MIDLLARHCCLALGSIIERVIGFEQDRDKSWLLAFQGPNKLNEAIRFNEINKDKSIRLDLGPGRAPSRLPVRAC